MASNASKVWEAVVAEFGGRPAVEIEVARVERVQMAKQESDRAVKELHLLHAACLAKIIAG